MNRSRLAIVPALLALVLAACGTSGSSSTEPPASTAVPSTAASEAPASAAASEAGSEEVRVTLENFQFDQTELTIPVGTRVIFLNADSAAHTVTEGTDGEAADGAFINDEIAGNQSTDFTFDEPGTYDITCLFHPTMNMTVTVEG
jgi:plastocyanin